MSASAYHLLWLLAGLLLAALLSAALTRHLRRRAARVRHGLVLAAALSRYSVWLAALHGPLAADVCREDAQEALRHALALQRQWFGHLAVPLARVLEGDRELAGFLLQQQTLQTTDIERWIASSPEQDLLRLRQAQQARVAELLGRLHSLAGAPA